MSPIVYNDGNVQLQKHQTRTWHRSVADDTTIGKSIKEVLDDTEVIKGSICNVNI